MKTDRTFFKRFNITAFLITLSAFHIFLLFAPPLSPLSPASSSPLPPNGRIAFTANIDGNWELFIVTPGAKDSTPIRLTNTPIDERTPRWSSDGKRIIYATTDGQIAMIDPDTKKATRFPNLEGKNDQPDLAPSGDKIVYVHFNPKIKEDTDLFLFSIGKEHAERFMRQPSAQYYPRWSPDGSKITYITIHCYPDNGRVIQELWLAEGTGYEPRQLLLTNSMCMDPAWSPDGEKIAFSSDMKGNFDIWVYDCQKKILTQETEDANLDCNPSWSPDGKSLAFVSNRTGISSIWIKDIKTDKIYNFCPFSDRSVMCKDLDWEKGR